MTVVDLWGLSERSANAPWLQDVDADGVFQLLVESLNRV
jgi:inosine-uridine nucleoside N-ribohydrolase